MFKNSFFKNKGPVSLKLIFDTCNLSSNINDKKIKLQDVKNLDLSTNKDITLHFNIHEFYYNALDYITPRWRLLHNLNYVELGKKVVFPIYSQYKSTPSWIFHRFSAPRSLYFLAEGLLAVPWWFQKYGRRGAVWYRGRIKATCSKRLSPK